jgi:hypothetical protein
MHGTTVVVGTSNEPLGMVTDTPGDSSFTVATKLILCDTVSGVFHQHPQVHYRQPLPPEYLLLPHLAVIHIRAGFLVVHELHSVRVTRPEDLLVWVSVGAAQRASE